MALTLSTTLTIQRCFEDPSSQTTTRMHRKASSCRARLAKWSVCEELKRPTEVAGQYCLQSVGTAFQMTAFPVISFAAQWHGAVSLISFKNS